MSITCINTALCSTCWHFLSSKWPHRLKLIPTRDSWDDLGPSRTVRKIQNELFKALVPSQNAKVNESKTSHFWTGVFFESGLNIWRWRGWHKYLDGLRISYLGLESRMTRFLKGFDDLKFSIRTLAHLTSNYKLSQVIWGRLRSFKVNPDFQDLKKWYRLTTNWGNEMTTNHKGSFLAPISNALPGAQVWGCIYFSRNRHF